MKPEKYRTLSKHGPRDEIGTATPGGLEDRYNSSATEAGMIPPLERRKQGVITPEAGGRHGPRDEIGTATPGGLEDRYQARPARFLSFGIKGQESKPEIFVNSTDLLYVS